MNWRDTLATVRHKAFPRAHALEQALEGLRAEHSQVMSELEAVRAELADVRVHEAQQLAQLQEQLAGADAERRAASREVDNLRGALDDARQRQQGADEVIRTLEARLAENSDRYESGLELTQQTIKQLHADQQGMLTLQHDLASTLRDVGQQLHDAQGARHPQPRLSGLQTAMLAGILFLAGMITSGLLPKEPHTQTVSMAPLESGITDLRELMQTHYESHDRLLTMLEDFLERERARLDRPSPDEPADVARRTAELKLLGFAGDAASLKRFRMFYAPLARSAGDEDDTSALLTYFARQARQDNARYGKDGHVLAAIRLASLRTGVDFAYLMELAAVESNFRADAVNAVSKATGLYQFKAATWLDAVYSWGRLYGLEDYASRIEYVVDERNIQQPVIEDAAVLERLLALRNDPRLAALLAAEKASKNMQRLSSSLAREPGRTDLYLSHFFGTSGAIAFLDALAKSPGEVASELFPGPASRNRSIFIDKARGPRTVEEIYRLFARRFDTRRFSDG